MNRYLHAQIDLIQSWTVVRTSKLVSIVVNGEQATSSNINAFDDVIHVWSELIGSMSDVTGSICIHSKWIGTVACLANVESGTSLSNIG